MGTEGAVTLTYLQSTALHRSCPANIETETVVKWCRILSPKAYGQCQSQLPQMIGHDDSHVQ